MIPLLKKIFFHEQFRKLSTYGIGQCFNLVTPLLVTPYIIGVCGQENFGKISIGMTISFFLMVFIDYGSDIVGVKEVAINREKPHNLEHVFVTTFGTKCMLLILVLAFSSLMFATIPYFQKEQEMFFFGLPILIGQFINPTWFLQGLEDFKSITILTIISKLIYVFGIFIFINSKQDYIFINLWWGIGTTLAHTGVFVYILRKYGFSFKDFRIHQAGLLIKQNFTLFTSQIFVSLQMYAPLMLIGFFGSNNLAGQFRIIDQVIVIFKTYILLFFNYVYPRVCYLLDKNIAEAMKFWKTYNGLNLIFITLSMLIIYIFAFDVVSYFNPHDKAEAFRIAGILKIAVFIPFLQAVTIPFKQLILGLNKQKQYVRITIRLTVFSILLMSVLIGEFGITGVLATLLISEIIMIVLFYYGVKNKIYPHQVEKQSYF